MKDELATCRMWDTQTLPGRGDNVRQEGKMAWVWCGNEPGNTELVTGALHGKAGGRVEAATAQTGHLAKRWWFSHTHRHFSLQGTLAVFENLSVTTLRLTGFIYKVFLVNSERMILTSFIIKT